MVPASKGCPLRGFGNTRSSSPANAERPRCSNSSPASRRPGAIVLALACDFGVSTRCRVHVSSTREALETLERRLNPGVYWGSWKLPVTLELALIAGGALVVLALAVRQFNRAE